METVTLSSKYQLVLPRGARERLRLRPGMRITVLDKGGVLFLVPELISLKRGDSLPPLTQTMRHFLPGWLAFPLIYGLLGAFGAKTLGFGRWWAVGVLFGLLGWLTEHFTFTYLEGDPRPGEEVVTPRTSSKKRLKL